LIETDEQHLFGTVVLKESVRSEVARVADVLDQLR
jgi:hypothetical protein